MTVSQLLLAPSPSELLTTGLQYFLTAILLLIYFLCRELCSQFHEVLHESRSNDNLGFVSSLQNKGTGRQYNRISIYIFRYNSAHTSKTELGVCFELS